MVQIERRIANRHFPGARSLLADVEVPLGLVPDQVAEIVSPEFPGELVFLNPRLRQQRARKREALN